MIRNIPSEWHLAADVVALGSGIGGLSAAITSRDHGASAVVLERSDKVGGVTAVSAGEVWIPGNHLAQALDIEDSPESGYRYLKGIAMDYGDEVAILNLTVHARVALKYFEENIGLKMSVIRGCPDYYHGFSTDGLIEGRMLEVHPFPANLLGAWQSRTRVSPLVPYAMTHKDMYAMGGVANMSKWDYRVMSERLANDERCLGAGLAAYFVKGALDRDIPLLTDVNAVELIGDGERIVGVRASKDGKDFFVKANRGVVIAVSSYERNANFSKTLGQQLGLHSTLSTMIDGANFRLAGAFGARVAKVPDVTMLGMHIPGEEHENGELLWRGAVSSFGLPHHIIVNRKGRRFGNEAFYRGLCYAIDLIDGNTQTHPNFPCWVVFDAQAREKYPFGSVTPGQDLPPGLGVKAESIAELAGKIGIDAQGLAATIAAFNGYCERSEDPEFQRGQHAWSAVRGDPLHKPNANLGPLSKSPYYAVELHRIGGYSVPAMGLVTDPHSRVIDWEDNPIEGLYAAGNSVARMETGAGMQSGLPNARGMTHGYLAGLHAAGKPSNLLQNSVL